jgi:hypothetical protein
MFTATLFIIVPNWEQPKHPSTGEQINIETMTYPHNRTVLNNKWELISNTCHSMAESQEHYVEKEARHNRLHTV